MIVTVASGKGGTGKTTVTASLARVWPRAVLALDLDVEEPNLHLFLRPRFTKRTPEQMPVPVVDAAACTGCGACGELCQFGAIAVLGAKAMTFPAMCHGCGGCALVCPEGAVSWGTRELGVVEEGTFPKGSGGAPFLAGRLRVGEAMSPPLMHKARAAALARKEREGLADMLVDAPPGVSCPAVTAVSGSDLVILVVEPTPFGLHDFYLAHEAFSALGPPLAVVVNKFGLEGGQALEEELEAFCARQGLPVLARIPYSEAAARAYAQGLVLAQATPELRALFVDLARGVAAITREAAHA